MNDKGMWGRGMVPLLPQLHSQWGFQTPFHFVIIIIIFYYLIRLGTQPVAVSLSPTLNGSVSLAYKSFAFQDFYNTGRSAYAIVLTETF